MAFSPLKTPGGARGGNRPKGSGFGLILGLLATAGIAALVWTYFFSIDSQVKGIRKLARAGKLDQAAEKLKILAQKHAEDPRVLNSMGTLANRQGRMDDASELYGQAHSQGLKAAAAEEHLADGKRYAQWAQYAQARVEFQHALELDPKSAKAMGGLALCAHAAGNLNRAMELYAQATALAPSDQDLQDGLKKARETKDRGALYYLFDRNGEPLARQQVSEAGLGERSYPLAQYAAHVIGAKSKRFGDQGLERDLSGLFPGHEVTLTLDSRVQDAARRAMGWRKGAVVVLNPNTGEILAALSQPAYKPATLDKDWLSVRDNRNKPLLNRALEGLFEPGSIFKIVTAAGALEYHVDMSSIFPFKAPTAVDYDGKIFRDWDNHGVIRSLKEAMDVSSNIAMAKVGFALGSDKLNEMTGRFGFNKPLELGLTLSDGRRLKVGTSTSLAPQHADTRFALAERSCGLGGDMRISPLHAALLAAAVANKGIMLKPQLIREVRSITGQVLGRSEAQVLQKVMEPETAEKLSQIMIDAVQGERGIGKKARVSGIVIAGKTGTARTKKNGPLDAWFICYAPAEDPQYAIAVLADGEGTGMSIAAPIAGALLRDILK